MNIVLVEIPKIKKLETKLSCLECYKIIYAFILIKNEQKAHFYSMRLCNEGQVFRVEIISCIMKTLTVH